MMHELGLILIAIYVMVNGATGAAPRRYEGQSPETVASLIASEGKTFTFITETEWLDYEKAHPIKEPKETPEKAALKAIAIDKSKTVTQRVNALIEYLEIK